MPDKLLQIRSLIPTEINRNWVPKGTHSLHSGLHFWLGCMTMLLGGTADGWDQPARFGFHFNSHVGATHCLKGTSQPLDHHQR